MKRAALAMWLALATHPAFAAPPCPPPPDESDVDIADLSHLAAALKPGATVEILALGSATLFGPPGVAGADATRKTAGTPPTQPSQNGFPGQAARALQAAYPGLRANVTILGRRGMAAADMLILLRQELARKPYRLVLWQTGTVEAVEGLSPEAFYQALADGADIVAAAGADLVLIDPQYSRFLSANANLQPYLAALQAAAALPGVSLFHRFDLMRDWAEAGAIDLERAPKPARQATALRLHACLGQELAREILAAR